MAHSILARESDIGVITHSYACSCDSAVLNEFESRIWLQCLRLEKVFEDLLSAELQEVVPGMCFNQLN